jgi:hypothetical protein
MSSVGRVSKPSISRPHWSLVENEAGPRITSSLRSRSHDSAVVKSAFAASWSSMQSNQP